VLTLDDCLDSVWSVLNATCSSLAVLCRKTALPLINKRWARVMREPSHAWLDVEVGCGSVCDDDADCDDEEKQERKLARQDADKLRKATTALSWFTRRPG